MVYLVYLLGFVVSIIGRHAGGAVAHRIIAAGPGHYVSWWGGLVGVIRGVAGSLLAVAPSLGVIRLLLGSDVSTWPPFVVAILYPTALAIFADKPDKLQIAHRRATIKGGIGIPEPYSRSAFDREMREVDEDYKREWLWFWGQLVGSITVIGIAAVVWTRRFS